LPLERIGKQRESLTVNSEEYQKQFLRYLHARQYYSVKASSDVEGTFADVVLTRKMEKREYWLEIKATQVSLRDKDFLKQLAKYLAKYLSLQPDKRFKLILACYKIVDWDLFKSVFEYLDDENIEKLVADLILNAEPHDRATIENGQPKEVHSFFEEATVKEADLKSLEFTEAKVAPKAPAKPSITEAEYADAVLNNFGDVLPTQEKDTLYMNLFSIEFPAKLFAARSAYASESEMYADTSTNFPPHKLSNGKVFTFEKFDAENSLSRTIVPRTVETLDTDQFAENEVNLDVLKTIVNRWIRKVCESKNLQYDRRTGTHYYHRKWSGSGIVIAKWKPKVRISVRELTRPMKASDGRVNYWVHRGAKIAAREFAGRLYVQIRPRFLFSWDGITLMEGSDADIRDRKFRKSIYNRNPNQLYDVRFWCRHIFPESENPSIVSLVAFTNPKYEQSLRIFEQNNLECERKPNEDQEVDVEALDAIESNSEQLSDFMEG